MKQSPVETMKPRDQTGIGTEILVLVSVSVSRPHVSARSQGQNFGLDFDSGAKI